MRLLQLHLGQDELLDLHPNMTVVQGLDDHGRRVLVEAVRGLARSEASPGGGLLEAHGVLFELRRELLALLDLTVGDIDPVVRPGDLPTQPLTVDARELQAKEQEFGQLLERIAAQAERQSHARDAVAAAEAAVREARRALADHESGGDQRHEQVAGLTARLQELADRRRAIEDEEQHLADAAAEAERALAEVDARTADVRDRARDALERHAAIEAERDALGVDLDDGAAAALDQARQAVEALDGGGPAAPDAATQPDRIEAGAAAATPPAAQLQGLEARLAEIDRRLAALRGDATEEVAEALAAVRAGGAGDLVPSAEAAALADDLRSLAFEIGADDTELVVEGSLGDARERLDEAQQALLEAEQGARNLQLDPAEVEQLESAHEALLDAIEKAEGRFAGGRARERVERLRAAEQEVLDRLGFASYSAYMMGSSLRPADPAKQSALAAARAELAAAEAAWRDLQQATDAALARAALLDRRRALVDAARRFLDPMPAIDDLAAQLRLVRVPVISAEQAADHLREVLVRQGLELGDEELDGDEVATFAEAWLAEAASAEARGAALVEERASLLADVDARRATIDAGAGPAEVAPAAASASADRPGDAERRARLDAARAALSAAEDRWLAHEVALERIAALQPRLTDAEQAAVSASEAARGADDEVAEARAAVEALRSRRARLDAELDRLAAEEAEARATLDEAAAAAGADPVQLRAAVGSADARHRDAELALDAETRLLASLDAEGQAVAIEIERLQDIVASQTGGGEASEAEELEWYLLARLAAQRSVSVAGALPLLLDDALRGLDAAGVDHLLGRLERMTEAVQVILVSEDPVVAAWANEAGPGRAAVVRPTAA